VKAGFFGSRHLGLLLCNITIMRRFLALFILTGLLFGQDVKTLYLFELEDESEYVGELIADTPDNVTIKRMDGSVVSIPAYKVIKRTKIDESQWDQE